MAKVLKKVRLKNLDGVKDVAFGKASVDARRERDFSKDGRASGERDNSGFADVEAREKRFGFPF